MAKLATLKKQVDNLNSTDLLEIASFVQDKIEKQNQYAMQIKDEVEELKENYKNGKIQGYDSVEEWEKENCLEI